MEITKEEFENLVEEALEEIPEYFKKHIKNLEFIVKEYPSVNELKRANIYGRGILLGLYEGVPLRKRGPGYQGVLPDRITLYMYPIIGEAGRLRMPLKEKIKKVLMHEIGHYFGLSEAELRELGIV
ncbi:MAG: metallopeptidase family protein [Caldisericaceae bacterium]|nr:metallopeptidase family protein [Caldisericaceae bacterium]